MWFGRPGGAILRLGAFAAASLMGAAALANDDVLALQSNPANVVMPSINYSGWNYSPLAQINLQSVGELTIAWTLQINVLDQFEASPLVVGSVMYIVTPAASTGPNQILALDLNDEGRILWEFRPEIADLERVLQAACCGAQTRGLNYAEGRIFYHTLDGQVFALDAATGEAVWRSAAADIAIGETTPGNGIVAGQHYIIGNAGGEYGVRGKVQAFNIDDGTLAWTMYSMGPNDDVGIGPRFQPFYADDRIANPAMDSWWGDSWRRGGGAPWGFFTYDPDSGLFFYSTGNCGPWNPNYRRPLGIVTLDEKGGLYGYKNNYCASQMARDADTGELVWAYNIVPQDQWDYDQPLISPLVDIDMDSDGTPEELVISASRAGFFYVWDRATGAIVNEPWRYVYVDFMRGVDLETGRPIYDVVDMIFTDPRDREQFTEEAEIFEPDRFANQDFRGTEVYDCPVIAARNWQDGAWSPQTGLYYAETTNNCGGLVGVEGEFIPSQGFVLTGFNPLGPAPRRDMDGNVTEAYAGALKAMDPVAGQIAWAMEWQSENAVPVMVTGGGLLFEGGTNEGEMRAFDAATGEEVWAFRTGSEFNQSPITYIGPDGRQYLAIIASATAPAALGIPDDEADDADRYARSGTTLYVFALAPSVAAAQNCGMIDPAPGFVCGNTPTGPVVAAE